MPKQGVSADSYLSSEQYELAKTLYKQALRAAVQIVGVATRTTRHSPQKKKQKLAPGGMLFRGQSALAEKEESPATPDPSTDFDPVVDEMDKWAHLAREHYQALTTAC